MGFAGFVRSMKIRPDLQALVRGAAPTYTKSAWQFTYPARKIGGSYCYSVLQFLVDDNVVCPPGGEATVKTREVRAGVEGLWLLCGGDGKKLSHVENLNVMVRGL